MDHGNGQTGVRDINTNVCNLVKKWPTHLTHSPQYTHITPALQTLAEQPNPHRNNL